MSLIALIAFLGGFLAAFFMPLLAFCAFGAGVLVLLAASAGLGLLPGMSALSLAALGAIALQIGYGAGIAARAAIWRRWPGLARREPESQAAPEPADASPPEPGPSGKRPEAGEPQGRGPGRGAAGHDDKRQAMMAFQADAPPSRFSIPNGFGQNAGHAIPKDRF